MKSIGIALVLVFCSSQIADTDTLSLGCFANLKKLWEVHDDILAVGFTGPNTKDSVNVDINTLKEGFFVFAKDGQKEFWTRPCSADKTKLEYMLGQKPKS